MIDIRRFQFGTVVLVVQFVFILCFAFMAEYDVTAQPEYVDADGSAAKHLTKMYPPFQDVHVMIFIGFGYLMTFLARYGLSAVGVNMLLASLVIQWAFIVRGVIHADPDVVDGNWFSVNIDGMVAADFAAATILISFGAVLGKTSPLQMLVMALIEVPIAQLNGWICSEKLHLLVMALIEVPIAQLTGWMGHDKVHATDTGESMYIHAFGAYFGLAVAGVLYNKEVKASPKAGTVYHSDIFSLVGTVFLWLYWPSFNGGGSDGDEQHRSYVNTYLSLCGCTLATFALSALYDKKGKFSADHIQNATLAGGVAVGTAAAMPLQPWGALLVGCLAGLVSVTGFRFIQAFIEKKLRVHDTCGVHNLHGMPGVLAAIVGAIVAGMSNFDDWSISLYEIFPNQAPVNGTAEYNDLLVTYDDMNATSPKPADGWGAGQQAGYQIAALVLTVALAIGGGVLTGLVMRLPVLNNIEDGSDLFDDGLFWNVADDMPTMDEVNGAIHLQTYSPQATEAKNGTTNFRF